jgi:transposase InsO family protein
MSRAGDCYDNALAESFFATFKAELVAHMVWATRQEAEWIEVFYNLGTRLLPPGCL